MKTFMLLSVLFPYLAQANDSTAIMASSGLVLEKTDSISMESESLYLSPEIVRVKYVFKNESKADIKTIVAFPMTPFETEGNYSVPVFDRNGKLKDNPLKFEVKVDGKLVPAKLETKQTEDEVSLKYYWAQIFPAGREITIEHSYLPQLGSGWDEDFAKAYCFDNSFKKSLNSFTSKLSPRFAPSQYQEYLHFHNQRLHYVLKTGANWKGPIKKFRLEIDKKKPSSLISLCWKGKLTKKGTTYIAEETNFTPTEDIAILLIDTEIKKGDDANSK